MSRIRIERFCRSLFADGVDHCRHRFGRHYHDGLAFSEKSCFVFPSLFVFCLTLVMLSEPANPLFIPPRRIQLLSSLGHFLFLHCRSKMAISIERRAIR